MRIPTIIHRYVMLDTEVTIVTVYDKNKKYYKEPRYEFSRCSMNNKCLMYDRHFEPNRGCSLK